METWCSLASTASMAADSAKNKFEKCQKLEIFFLILAALAQCFSEYENYQVYLNWITVISTILALFVALHVRAIRIEKVWQESRTISESAKKMMWFYVMKISPFDQPDNLADAEFLLSLDRIRADVKDSDAYLVKNNSTNDHITNWMSSVRSQDWNKRKDIYFKERICKQIEWYSSKSQQNSRGETLTFAASISFEILTVLFAIAILNKAITNTSYIGLLTTVAAVALGWGKMQHHKQLAQSYGVIDHLLKNKKQLWKHITTEQEFLIEVDKTEELISRENTNWSVVVSN
jgi:hypothetical protein